MKAVIGTWPNMGSSSNNNNQVWSDEDACAHAMQLASSSMLPMTLKAAIELNILDAITEAGQGKFLSPAEIAAKLKITEKNPEVPAVVDRMLRLLASFDVVACSVVDEGGGRSERRYGATLVTKYLSRNEEGGSIGALAVSIQDKVFMDCWYYFKDAVLEGGIAFNKAYGMSKYEYLGTDTRLNKIFNAAMRNHSNLIMNKILEIYEGFDSIGVLVDVGGGVGATLSMILAKHPRIKGINFDLPHVISQAPALPGVEHISGSMLESVPSGDAILMKWILHIWDDDSCVKVLKLCWKALPEKGKVIVMQGILHVAPEKTPAAKSVAQLDLVMLAQNPKGKDRTEEEYRTLAKSAGFSGFNIACTYADLSVMECYK